MKHEGTLLLEELTDAGWDPFHPSTECRLATARPHMPRVLGDLPRRSLHWHVATLQLMRTFGRGRRVPRERRHMLMKAAVLYVLAWERGDSFTPADAEQTYVEVDRWRFLILRPMQELLSKANPREVLANPWQFEPAFTDFTLTLDLDLVDVEDDAEKMSLGRGMHEEGTLHPKTTPPTSPRELEEYFDFVTTDHKTVSFFDEQGKLRLIPERIKTRLDSLIGRQQKPSDRESSLELVSEPAAENTELLAVDATLDIAKVRQVIAVRRQQAPPGSCRAHVLEHLERLVQGEVSLRELAKEKRVSSSALHEAYQGEIAAVRAALRVA
jgi:hypothetical protein